MSSPGTKWESLQRIDSIDVIRGLVMVIMALDHVRDWVHAPSIMFQDPTDLATTTPWLFFTRFVTHFCAPTFVFLSGTSIFLSMMRRGADRTARLFLLKRGLWLIFLELTVITFGWFFMPSYPMIVLQVIWAIGVSMIVLSLTTAWGVRANLVIGLAIIFGHNLLDLIPSQPNDFSGNLFLNVVHDGLFTPLGGGHFLALVYPVLPWIGIMMTGYAFGILFTDRYATSRRQIMRRIGISAIILFVVLRAINLYGDPLLWSMQKDWIFTLMSFLRCEKYPPSLLYSLMTLGPTLLLLSLLPENYTKSYAKPYSTTYAKPYNVLRTFGRVPMFYYILHIYLGHAIGVVLIMMQGYPLSAFGDPNTFSGAPQGSGYGLVVTYATWIALILMLYPLCVWYDGVKTRRKDIALLRYL